MRNYTELCKALSDELARDDLAQKVPEWVLMAESALSRFVGLMDGEQFATASLVVAQPYIDLPSGFKRPIHIEIQGSPLRVLNIVSLDKRSDVLENDPETRPRTISFIGRRGYLAPVPGAVEVYHLFYYGKPPALSRENPTNDLLEMGPDVLFYEALTHSAPYLADDERLQTWFAMRNEGRETLKREYWDAHASGGILRVRTDFAPGDSHDQGAVQT